MSSQLRAASVRSWRWPTCRHTWRISARATVRLYGAMGSSQVGRHTRNHDDPQSV
jgi:hypothetical protein